MATEVVMPKLGLTMEQGTIGSWLAAEGDQVKKGQPLIEVVTDKVTMDVEAQVTGVLRKIIVEAGNEVPVATLVGVIGSADEDITDLLSTGAGVAAAPAPEPTTAPPTPAPAPAVPVAPAPVVAAAADGRPHRASPKARKIAAERGVDLTAIAGTGPVGRIVSADVLAGNVVPVTAPSPVAASAPITAPIPAGVAIEVELTRPQQVAAERLTASYQQVPHIHVWMEISAVWMQQFRQGYALEGKKVSFNDLIVKACARVLSDFPRFNSHFLNGKIHQLSQVDIGIATDTPSGLMVPVLRDVAQKSVEGIAIDSATLVDRTRRGALGPDEMAGGGFTISNLGMFGVSRFTAIINPPQVAILAVGAIENRVVALDNGALASRPCMSVDLAGDHRAVDGASCARFLQRLKEVLETPGLLV
jgi:pyruvate dehydrogenase E2 component (dihydrolipoamide acetyltransferase)